MARQNNTTGTKNKTIENSFLIGIILIGLIGTVYFFYNSGKTDDLSLDPLNEDWSIPTDEPTTTNRQTGRQYLRIEGTREAGEKLFFTIASFNKRAQYELNFGNGSKKVLRDNKVSFVYREAGTFNLSLTVFYEGRTRELYREVIRIEASSGIASVSF